MRIPTQLLVGSIVAAVLFFAVVMVIYADWHDKFPGRESKREREREVRDIIE